MREWNRKYTWLGPSSDGMLREEGRTVPENVQGMLPSVTFACYPPEQLPNHYASRSPGGDGQRLYVGLTIYNKPFQEDLILRIGYASEQATDWHRRTPDLSWVHG
jgi:hypothetical protein